jgi:hypothetical protein
MSLRFIMMGSGALLVGILFVVSISDPCYAAPLIGPHRVRQDIIVRVATCIKRGRTCTTSNQCCSGNCVERGSKGFVCL